jgi:hypothetical protein
MACVSYCDSSLLDHNLVNCNEYKLGGVSAILVGACGTELVDPSDEVEVQALMPAGSPVTVDSPIGCGTPIRINEDRTATLYDANVTDENNTFWNDVNNRRIAWVLAFMCDSGKVIYIDPPVGITTSANFILPEQNNELQRYEVTFSWRDKNIPAQYDAPAGIFG